MKKLITTAMLFLAFNVSSNVNAQTSSSDDIYVSISGGLGFADVSEYAAAVAQLGANALGETVYYSYDRATWAGKGSFGYEFTENINFEVGYFMTGDIDIKYSIASGVAVEEAFSGSGFDYSVKYDFDTEGLYARLGGHSSDLDHSASVTLNGTTFATTTVTTSGTGALIGLGYEMKEANGSSTFFGYDLYQDVGGSSGADFGYLYYGVRF
jgi:hypothetical protein